MSRFVNIMEGRGSVMMTSIQEAQEKSNLGPPWMCTQCGKQNKSQCQRCEACKHMRPDLRVQHVVQRAQQARQGGLLIGRGGGFFQRQASEHKDDLSDDEFDVYGRRRSRRKSGTEATSKAKDSSSAAADDAAARRKAALERLRTPRKARSRTRSPARGGDEADRLEERDSHLPVQAPQHSQPQVPSRPPSQFQPGLQEQERQLMLLQAEQELQEREQQQLQQQQGSSPPGRRNGAAEVISGGRLRLRVLRALNLRNTDIGILPEDASDPFVVARMGRQEFKTQVIENSLNPVWNSPQFEFTIQDEDATLLLEVFSSNQWHAHDSLGRMQILVQNLTPGESQAVLEGLDEGGVLREDGLQARLEVEVTLLTRESVRAGGAGGPRRSGQEQQQQQQQEEQQELQQLHPPGPPGKSCFTQRIAVLIQAVCGWDFLEITWWVYLFCGFYFIYNVFPLLLNVGLSWLRSVTAEWPFGIIVGSTFLIGVVAFLLPPVPGMTVYIFGGLVVSGTCPWGFWWGTVINIGMCWFLKLVACAVQQKCIGGMLGRSLWVRSTAGVHKVAIRCIEAELRVKGWTAGKIAILCGGPDWPTSVIAGVLGLSLWECELGTVPIIGFVLPCAMSGSLYIKKGEGQLWSSAADMMIVASVVVNLTLWVVAFWAIQHRLESDYANLSRRLPENVDLHWLDHKSEVIAQRSYIPWSETPLFLRFVYLFGAAAHILVCDLFTAGSSILFGDFAVQDPIDTLVLIPTEGKTGELFTWNGLLVIAFYAMTSACFFVYILWRQIKTAAIRREAAQELRGQEAEWKQAFLKEVAEEEAQRKFGNPDDDDEPMTPPPKEAYQTVSASTVIMAVPAFITV
uniref:RanBP2-type domain-containing protein n=1 Tax=Alexandrium monilatum TaxID=311494 RepID=A0A7S4UP67_9DINO